MAKKIRLNNVDVLKTSSGRVLDLDNISFVAAPSNGKADGHSSTAALAMSRGGYNSGGIWLRKTTVKSYEASANISGYANLGYNVYGAQAGSDGSTHWAVSGYNGNNINSTSSLSFASGATSTTASMNNLSKVRYGSSHSTPDFLLISHGYNGSNNISNYRKALWSSMATSASYGDGTADRHGGASATNDTDGWFFGGSSTTAAADRTQGIQVKSLASSANAVSTQGIMNRSHVHGGGCANGDEAIISHGYGNNTYCLKKDLRSNANTTNFGALSSTQKKYSDYAASSSEEGIFVGGTRSDTSSYTASCEKKSFSSSANAADWGNADEVGGYRAVASGNS